MTPEPKPPDVPRDMRQRESEAHDHENRREQRTLEEITERYLALLRAEKERRAAETDTDDAPKG